MATPYVMSKVPTCYYPCDAETDLPECCKEASSKPRYAYWCSACKVEPGGGGHHGTAAARRRRSLSETAEPADPLREQNHRADHWKRPVKEYGDGALHGGCAAYQPSLRPYDTEYVEEALPGEAGRVGAGACPSKRPKERLLPLPFCSMATDYEPEVVTTPGASAAVASAAGGNHPHPHHAPAPAPRRLEVCAQTLLIEGPYSAPRAAPPHAHPPVQPTPQQQLVGRRRALSRYTPEVEALRSRLRELRGAVPAGGNSTGVGVSSTLSEGKRLRQRSESDPGHGCLSSAAVAAAADAVRRLQQVVASTTGHANVMSAAARALVSPNGPGGGCAATTCDAREAKRARDASPVPPELPPSALEKHRPVVAHSPTRIAHCRAFHKTKGASRVLRRGDSSESDYDDQTPDSGAVVDCKDVPQEDSEEVDHVHCYECIQFAADDARSVMSSLTTASSSDSASPSLVGETLGSISLSDTGLSSRITTPHAPIKPVTPPRPPMAASSFIVRRKGDLPRSLRSSLFSHVPPFIRFSMHDAKGEPLPPEVSSILKWKLSTITPVVVRRTLVNSGFRLVRKSNEWSGTWGKHMKSLCFRTLKEFQKINHFPGTFQIGRKDRLWKNLYRLMTKFGRKEFGFIPRTYVLPQDSKLLRQAWEKNCGKEKWIIKPPASARGTGIKVIHRWAQIPKKRPLVVQKYIADPYLINGSKFDLRLYVLVTSMNPMRVYIYDDGLVRFASVKYSGDMATLSDRYMHLTNYSINKLSSMYTQNEDASACQGHKWTVKTLWSYMEKLGVDVNRLWDNLVDLCIKTVISGEPSISQLTRSNLPSRYCSYELFGIDVLLDEHLKPWLLEVNISPSLHSASPLDLAVKGPLVRDLMNLAGYHVPNKLVTSQVEELLTQFGVPRDRISSLCFDRRLYTTLLGPEERQKHHMFQAYTEREEYLADILEKLTPDDVRHLIQAEDELTQAGRFIRIFPTPDTHLYLEYFESPSYYNRLFDAWETKYHMNRQEGIERLEYLCRKKHHLNVPPVNATAKFSVSQQVLPAEEGMDDMGLGLEKTSTEDMTTTTERKVLTLSSVALYRAARPRSGKLGVVLKPFPRSSYVSRKPRTSAPALAPTPASTPPATASAEDRGGGDGDGAGAGGDSPPPRRPRPRFRPARRISEFPCLCQIRSSNKNNYVDEIVFFGVFIYVPGGNDKQQILWCLLDSNTIDAVTVISEIK
ncbi:Tubulin polyglutamylase TTLL4 [Gryllus bimaculatus]|nr:Tubulin polyglutamylase TTLL4 [Gryllus bimaculatus]